MSLSKALVQKSVAAAIAAIEVYNKPAFFYREESFAVLMVNAWELLLKARVISDSGDSIDAIIEFEKGDESGASGTEDRRPKIGRSGNPLTVGLGRLMEKLVQQPESGFSRAAKTNVELMIEIRDNAIHLVNGNAELARRVQEIGTASLQNYLQIAQSWFDIDLTQYNFFLMPISFFSGSSVAQAASVGKNSTEQLDRLLAYITSVRDNEEPEDAETGQHVMLTIETRLIRSKDADALPFRWTADPLAQAITVREEDALNAFPLDYTSLRKALKGRYDDFSENTEFHRLKRLLEVDPKYCKSRYLDPRKPSKTSRKSFYSTEIFKEFDKHYRRRGGK